MEHDSLEALVAELGHAREVAAGVAGRDALGVRAVEPAAGRRWYLCAFEGADFLCLDARFRPEGDRRRARQAASCALLLEHAESLVDAAELRVLAAVTERLLGRLDDRGLDGALGVLGEGALALSAWRLAPERAVASLPELDRGIRLHDGVRTAYERFVEVSEPLVARQAALPGDVVDVLRDLEESAGRAGVPRPLASAVAEAMTAVDAGAEEIVAQHLTPLRGRDG